MPYLPDQEPVTEHRTRLSPRYHVVLLDDDHHTYEYVVEMLGTIFGHSRQRAFDMACEVDASGRCIVYTGPYEYAEFRKDRIHDYGADPRIAFCVGSMTAILESADD